MQTLTYPDNSSIQYQYGSDGRINSIVGFVTNVRYSAWGEVEQARLPFRASGIDWAARLCSSWTELRGNPLPPDPERFWRNAFHALITGFAAPPPPPPRPTRRRQRSVPAPPDN